MSDAIIYCKNCETRQMCHMERKCMKESLGLSSAAGSRLAELCRELFEILDEYEVSDSGREFHPTTIHSCRVMHCKKLDEILPEMKKLSLENTEK